MSTQRIIELGRKALTASPEELRVRLRQLLFAAHNRLAATGGGSALSPRGHLRSLRMSTGGLSDWWQQRDHSWFLSQERRQHIKQLAHQDDSGLPWVMEQADLVVRGKMPLFSHEPISFEGPDRWHRDFILGKSAPRDLYGFVPYLDANSVGDSKHVWEPNRCAWALWLGLAHNVTAEAAYAACFCELIEDWFEQNPYPIGINYSSALEVALRNYAWLWSLHLFSDQWPARPDLLEKILAGIWIGCRHIEENLSTYFAPNTHITGEAFGLFACGAAIPEFQDAERWRKLGAKILLTEAERQFHSDGMHRELSSGYHIYSTDFYVQAELIARETGYPLPTSLGEHTERMAVRLAELAPTDFLLPQINDCDGGRLLSLVPRPLDAAPTLQAADSILEKVTLFQHRPPARGYAVLMAQSPTEDQRHRRYLRRYQLPLDRNISSIYDSGLVSHSTASGDYLLFRASPFGYADHPHSHDGGLGIVLHLQGIPILVDSGTGSYTQSEDERNHFRCNGKNVPQVNGATPSRPARDPFSWDQVTDTELTRFRQFQDGCTACGKHTGFSAGAERNVFLQREVTMLDAGIIAVVDRWDADYEISVESRFTLHPDLHCDAEHQLLQHPEQSVHFSSTSLHCSDELTFTVESCPYSPNYGRVTDTTSIAFQSKPSRRGGIVTVFSRLGTIHWQSNRVVKFADSEADIQLRMTAWGVEAGRSHQQNSTISSVSSPSTR